MIDRERAIKGLEWVIDLFSSYERHAMGDEEMQSLNDAIMLLKAQELLQDNDLISREAAINLIEGFQRELCPVGMFGRYAVYGSDRDKFDNLQFIIDELEMIPAVDAAPVVHGRWIYKERHRKSYRQYTGYDAVGDIHTVTVLEETGGKEPYCSECGAQAAESYMDFCPHCGARMDGGENGAEQ